MSKSRADRLQAALLLAPVLVCAWPYAGSVLRHDVAPQATGIGFTALALIPSAVCLVARRAWPAVRALWFLLVSLLVAGFWVSIDHSTDTFEGSRVLMHWIVALHCLLAGASLGEAGRTLFVRGLVVASAAFVAFALFDAEQAFTGALGNTGSISEVGLLGAVTGVSLAVLAGGIWRSVGIATFVLFLAYAARVPVLAGALSAAFGCAALVVALRAAHSRRRIFAVVMLGCALVALVVPFGQRFANSKPSVTETAATVKPDFGPTGGVGVRLMIWQGSLKLFAEHPLLGVGAGQFAARFPEHRLQQEIERTTYDRRRAEETEVEHPHNDWLAPWLEGGLIAGLAWTIFLLSVARAAFVRLASSDPVFIAASATALAVLANAFVRGPLSWNPMSSPLAFALFGLLLVRDDGRERAAVRMFVVVSSTLLLLALSVRAQAFVRHGFALQAVALREAEPEEVERAVAAALDACPDSALALTTAARVAAGRGEAASFVLDRWLQVLQLRPQRIEALLSVANILAAQDPDRARAAYERVLHLDPAHPVAIQNLGTLAFNEGRVAAGLAWFERLPPARALSRDWLEHLAARLALKGIDDAAEALFVRVDPAFANASGEECMVHAKAAEAAGRGKDVVDAWKARAHRRWARGHALIGRYGDAVRSYRQDLYLCEIHGFAPRRVLLELAAALQRDGRTEEARSRAAGLEPSAEDLAAMPDWARTTLQSGFEEAKK
ncbi:MAG: O-antigen ligase family protein [Planctomycetes bacterium]|nr:O-antigen ligase family protein [Planctomycetota bacterium]